MVSNSARSFLCCFVIYIIYHVLPCCLLAEAKGLRAKPALGPYHSFAGSAGSASPNSCGAGAAALVGATDSVLAIGRCREIDGKLELRLIKIQDSNVTSNSFGEALVVPVPGFTRPNMASLSSPLNWSPVLVTLDASTLVLCYRLPDAVTVHVASVGQTEGGEVQITGWGSPAKIEAPQNAISLQLLDADRSRLLVGFAGYESGKDYAFACLVGIGSSFGGVNDLDANILHRQRGPSATLVRLLKTSDGLHLAVTLSGSRDQAALVMLPLDVSEFQVIWNEQVFPIEIDSPSQISHSGPIAVEVLGQHIAFLAMADSGLLSGCGVYAKSDSLLSQFSATLSLLDSSSHEMSSSLALHQLRSDVALAVHEAVDQPNVQQLRFARCVVVAESVVLEWGPPEDLSEQMHDNFAMTNIATSGAAYSAIAWAGTESLRIVNDLRCEAPSSAVRYDVSQCDAIRPSSLCEVTCAPEAVNVGPVAVCNMDQGLYTFSGCVGPACFVPANPDDSYDVTRCDTSLNKIRAEQCELRCASGEEGAVAVCLADGADFQLNGCIQTLCSLPADTTGYETAGCDTSKGKLPAYKCKVTCAAGFKAAMGVKVEGICMEGNDQFDLSGCFETCSSLTGIPKAAEPSCHPDDNNNNGAELVHLSNCETRCLPGYSPYPPLLRCTNGRLRPSNFECQEDSCESPKNITHALDPPCEAGRFVLPENPCIALCEPGYTPTVEKLICREGVFTPKAFVCAGNPCDAPTGIMAALEQPCAEGLKINHTKNCTAQCLPGYSPDPPTIACLAQQLQPAVFMCGADCSAPVGIPNALEPACKEGSLMKHTGYCTPLCEDGYSPLVASRALAIDMDTPQLLCEDGILVPPRFTCAGGVCRTPSDVMFGADPACVEGWSVGHGGSCSPRCERGYTPTVASLKCWATVLTPPTYACELSKCQAPLDVHYAHPKGPCLEGRVVPHLQACTPRCRFGYAPSERRLECNAGALQPESFLCTRSSVISSNGASSLALAPFIRSTTQPASRALSAYLDWERGLSVQPIYFKSGVIHSEDAVLPELEPRSADILPNSIVLLPDPEYLLLVYMRSTGCGDGGIEAVGRVVGTSPQALHPNGRHASRTVNTEARDPALTAAWFRNLHTAAVVGNGFALAVSVAQNGWVEMSQVLSFEVDDVIAASVTTLDDSNMIVTYADERGCLYSRKGQLYSRKLQWLGDAQQLDVEFCDDASVRLTSMALTTLPDQQVVLITAWALSGVRIYIGGNEDLRLKQTMPRSITDEAVQKVVCASFENNDNLGAILAVGLQTSQRFHIRWLVINQHRLVWSSVSFDLDGIGQSSSVALEVVGYTEVALLYERLGKTVSGVLVPNVKCLPPPGDDVYNATGCQSSGGNKNLLSSHCAVQCFHSGRALAECPADGSTFVFRGCLPACKAPKVDYANEPACQEGAAIVAGTACTPSCLPGYKPSKRALHCSTGGKELSPRSFRCKAQGCAAPTCIKHAEVPSCTVGWHIPHDSACIPLCQAGFEPSHPYLFCSAGVLSPATFQCQQVGTPCIMPYIQGAANPPCDEGNSINDGLFCSPRCRAKDSMSTVSRLSCVNGVLDPPFFTCAPSCKTPEAVPNSFAPPCNDGVLFVRHGQTCDLRCQVGFLPQPAQLLCDHGRFPKNGFFTCVLNAKACKAPASILHLNVGDRNASENPEYGFSYCKEGPEVPHGRQCNARCGLVLFSPGPAVLTCSDGGFFPESFVCGRVCDTVTSMGYVANSMQPACAEGDRVPHVSWCTPACISGFQASVEKLWCFDGMFDPLTFDCKEVRDGCDAPVGVEEGSEPHVCKEGSFIPSGGICTPQCNLGFLPTAVTLECISRLLNPPSFRCVVECLAPVGIIHGGSCIEGRAIPDGFSCTTACDPGYRPDLKALPCVSGLLRPAAFTCHPTCRGVVGVAGLYSDPQAVEEAGVEPGSAACEEGSIIEHARFCTASCADGFVADVPSLDCLDGSFTPPVFQCVQGKKCDSPNGIANSAYPSCVEGFETEHNSTCTPLCKDGYVSSLSELYCWDGVFTPLQFECNRGCRAPTVANGSFVSSCAQGEFVLPGEYCDTRCRDGFSPSIQKLHCSLSGSGVFTPPKFFCGQDCGVPGVRDVGFPPCIEGVIVKHTGTCRLNCSFGLTPEGQLVCENGRYLVSGAAQARCLRRCSSPDVSKIDNAASPTCVEGTQVPHLGKCTTRCVPSYKPFTPTLHCDDGTLYPDRFSCLRDGNFRSTTIDRFHHGAAIAARVASLDEGSFVVIVTSPGQLSLVIGMYKGGDWIWGSSRVCQDGASLGHDFFARVTALNKKRFLVSYSDHRDGSGIVRVGVIRSGLVASLGCAKKLVPERIKEMQAMALSSVDVPGIVVAYVTREGRVALRIGHAIGAVLAMSWKTEVTLAAFGASDLAVASLDFAAVVVGFRDSADDSLNQERYQVRIVKTDQHEGVLGPIVILNSASTSHVAMNPLSNGRFVVAFQDERSLGASSRMVIGRTYRENLTIVWGEQLGLRPSEPTLVLALSPEGPVLTISANTASWYFVRDLELSLGRSKVVVNGRTDSPVIASGSPDPNDELNVVALTQIPVGISFSNEEVLLLFPGQGQVGPASVGYIEWPCMLPHPSATVGYDVSSCDTSKGPIQAAKCLVSCGRGYEALMQAPLAHCPSPPSKELFVFSGCSPIDCVAPRKVINAANVSCKEGDRIAHGSQCHAKCQAGFDASNAVLSCEAGQLTPPEFVCLAQCCDQAKTALDASAPALSNGQNEICLAKVWPLESCSAPMGISLALEPSCKEGAHVKSLGVCTPDCGHGQIGSIPSLFCNNGALEPPIFACVSPSIFNGSGESSTSEVPELYLVVARMRFTLFEFDDTDTFDLITEKLETSNISYLLGLEAAFAQSFAGLLSSQIAIQITTDDTPQDPLLPSTLYVSSKEGFDVPLELYALGKNRSQALRFKVELTETLDDGNALPQLEDAVAVAWRPLLDDDDQAFFANGDWLTLKLPRGAVNSSLAIQVRQLSLTEALSLPLKLQDFLRAEYPDFLPPLQTHTAISKDSDEVESIFKGVGGPLEPALGAFYIACVHMAGPEIGIVIVFFVFAIILFIVLFVPPFLHFRCRVRKRTTLSEGNPRECNFRALYVLPDSHRYNWKTNCPSRCRFCRCRRHELPCRQRRSGKRRSFHFPSLVPQLQTSILVCCCPCLRVPETWHVSGVLSYWKGVVAFCICPICIPCLGFHLRVVLRRVFAMPSNALQDMIAWFCCFGAGAVQEALHVDGAARALIRTTEIVKHNERMMNRIMDAGAKKTKAIEDQKESRRLKKLKKKESERSKSGRYREAQPGGLPSRSNSSNSSISSGQGAKRGESLQIIAVQDSLVNEVPPTQQAMKALEDVDAIEPPRQTPATAPVNNEATVVIDVDKESPEAREQASEASSSGEEGSGDKEEGSNYDGSSGSS